MKSCSSCSRPLLPVAKLCPFCGVRLSTKWVATASAAVVTPFLLSACYGSALLQECFDEDVDGDGFLGRSFCQESIDCDDTDASINPGATEVCDDAVDNNCDGIFAGADTVEVCGNGLDDDCDGEIDERASEPGLELNCEDGLDDDCDGWVDGEDADCGGIEPDTDTRTSGDLVIDYTFDGPTAVVDCETARLSTLTVVATGPEPVSSFSIACDDAEVPVNALVRGTWSVELSGNSTSGEQWWGTVEDVLVTPDGTSAVVVLGCLGADGLSPCDESRTETP